MIRSLLIVIIIMLGWSSPEIRVITANSLRFAADFIEPKDNSNNNPKTIEIPNPFYTEED